MKYDIFISCKREDYPFARKVYQYLREHNYHVFLADTELRKKGNAEYGEIIDDALVKRVELHAHTMMSQMDGVTKLAKMNFSSKQAQNYANTRKIITGITEDVRIIIIKLADRLHNMRTIDALKPERQHALARETLEVFAPIAHRLGIYKIESELEDLSLKINNKYS